jgi:hypothetical protein
MREGGLVVLLLAERARSEGARTTLAAKGNLGQPSLAPLLRFEIQGGCSGGLEV